MNAIILSSGLAAIVIVVILVVIGWAAGRPRREKYRDTAARVRDRNAGKKKGDGRHEK